MSDKTSSSVRLALAGRHSPSIGIVAELAPEWTAFQKEHIAKTGAVESPRSLHRVHYSFHADKKL